MALAKLLHDGNGLTWAALRLSSAMRVPFDRIDTHDRKQPAICPGHMGARLAFCAAPFFTAAALALCFPPYSASVLAWLALLPLAYAAALARRARPLYFTALVAGLCFHLAALDWVRTSYGGAGLAGPRAAHWFLQAVILAPSFPLALWLLRLLASKAGWPMTAALPASWVVMEYARRHLGTLLVESPFPWLQLALSQDRVATLIQIADFGGTWLVTALVATFNGALVDLLLVSRRPASTKRRLVAVSIGLACLAAAILYGRWRISTTVWQSGPVIALMPSATAGALESPATAQPKGAVDETAAAADLLVWSEAVLDAALIDAEVPNAEASTLAGCLKSHAGAMTRSYLVGCRRVARRPHQSFNSLALVTPLGITGWYDKIALVPWTEFLPNWVKPIITDRSAGYCRGNSYPVFPLTSQMGGRTRHFAVAICYDVCYPAIFRRYFRSGRQQRVPDLFVVAGCELADKSGSLQRSLLAMTRFRAVECRRSIVRNADGGYSGLIDSAGRTVDISGPRPLRQPWRVSGVPIDCRESWYVRLGDWPPLVCCLVAGGAWVRVAGSALRRAARAPFWAQIRRPRRPRTHWAPFRASDKS
jgi:apolipoprotein N-acyltransferase